MPKMRYQNGFRPSRDFWKTAQENEADDAGNPVNYSVFAASFFGAAFAFRPKMTCS